MPSGANNTRASPRRRQWRPAEKSAIVAESFAPRAVASAIALRHGLHRNQLYTWRRELRSSVVAFLCSHF